MNVVMNLVLKIGDNCQTPFIEKNQISKVYDFVILDDFIITWNYMLAKVTI